MSYERSARQRGGDSHEGRRKLAVVSGDTPYPRTRYQVRIGDGKGIEYTRILSNFNSVKMLDRISREPEAEASRSAVESIFPKFASIEDIASQIESTRAELGEEIDLHYGAKGYSIRNAVTRARRKLKVLETTIITSSTSERFQSEPEKDVPRLVIDKESGDVKVNFGDHTNKATLDNPVKFELLLHIVDKPGKIFTYEELEHFIDIRLIEPPDYKRTGKTPRVGIYISQLNRMLQGESLKKVIEAVPREDDKFNQRFNYRFNGTVEFVGPQH